MWEQHLAGKEIGLKTSREPFDASRPSLLCVHGSGGRGLVFNHQINGLGSAVNVAAIDLPGHGDTRGPSMTVVDEYADWLGDFLAAGSVRPVLLGSSLGGAVIMTLALKRPSLIKGLVLVGTGSRLRVLPAILDGIQKDHEATVKLIVQFAYAPQSGEMMQAQAVKQMLQTPAQVLWGDFTACNGYDVSGRLGELKMPTLVVVGEEDKLTPPKYAQFLSEHIPGARMVTIPQGGHMVYLERPEPFNQAVLEFLAER